MTGGLLPHCSSHSNTSLPCEMSTQYHYGTSQGTGKAHGKIILLGEHAVVYGVPAIAIPVPQLTVTVTINRSVSKCDQSSNTPIVCVEDSGIPFYLSKEFYYNLTHLITHIKNVRNIHDNQQLNIHINSLIHPGRGLGSSAAWARAIVLALSELYNCRFSPTEIFNFIQVAEQHSHGRSSGIDALISGANDIIYYSQGQAAPIQCQLDGIFVISDSGESSKTKDAIEHVQQIFQSNYHYSQKFITAIANIVSQGHDSLLCGNKKSFGTQLNDNHALLYEIGLTTPRIDALVDSALTAGALGAKITGGGLGGCVIALASDPNMATRIADQHRDIGVKYSWFVPVGKFSKNK